MKIKTVDKICDILLWVIFIGLCLLTYKWDRDFCGPKYEVPPTGMEYKYTYEDKDGAHIESVYYPAWARAGFGKKELVFYDPVREMAFSIKPQYVDEFYQTMPESNYTSWPHHCFLLWLVIGIVVWGLVVYFLGGMLRDSIVFMFLKGSPSFENVSYFLFHAPMVFKQQARNLIPVGMNRYIGERRSGYVRKYKPEVLNMLDILLGMVRISKSTDILFLLKVNTNVQPMGEYLRRNIEYVDMHLNAVPNGAGRLEYLKKLAGKTYYDIPENIKDIDLYKPWICRAMNQTFEKIMGDKIFHFDVAELKPIFKPLASLSKNLLRVEINVYNQPDYYSSSSLSRDIPKLGFSIKIYGPGATAPTISSDATTACTYTFSEDNFNIKDLYRNMISDTLENASKKLYDSLCR